VISTQSDMQRNEMTSRATALCRLADRPDDFQRLALRPDAVAAWEDGLRTDTAPGSYEWWYFDAHLEDGTSLVISFYTKNPMSPDHPLEPYVTMQLDRPGVPTLMRQSHAPREQFRASSESCDVLIANSWIRGHAPEVPYAIHFAAEDVVVDVVLRPQVPSWRPATGHVFFGERDEHFFAWLPSVPQGSVDVDITVGTHTEHLKGIGYHDHNWGDVAMPRLINHWYWGRAQAGPYSIIASYITAEHRYGGTEIPIFLLAKGATIVADDATKVRFRLEGEHVDQQSGKPVADVVVYDYTDRDDEYRVSFRRAQTIVDHQLIEEVSGVKHLLARLAHFDGSYLRFTGTVQLEHLVGNRTTEDVSDPGIWELMYFGRTALHQPTTAP
jgi:hypothetical protein